MSACYDSELICVFFFQMPGNVFEEIKYLEIMIVSDHNMVCALKKTNQVNT